MRTLRDELDDTAHTIELNEREWVLVPYTEQSRYGEGDVVHASNYRSLLRDFEGNSDVGDHDHGVIFNIDTTDESVIEAYNGLLVYPLYDEEDESALRMEREQEAWEDSGLDAFVAALVEQYPDVELWPSAENLDALFYDWMQQGSVEWEHTSEGVYLDFNRLVEHRINDVGEEAFREELGAAYFSVQAAEAKQRLTQIVGLNERTSDTQLLLLIQVLYDLGYQPRNGVSLTDDAHLDALAQEPPVPGLIAMFDADPNAEEWYIFLAERWLAFTALRNGAAYAFGESEEDLVAFMEESKAFFPEDMDDPWPDVIAAAEAHGLIGLEPTHAYIAPR